MRLLWVIAAGCLLAACASTPEGGKRAPLPAFAKEVEVRAAWSRPVGAWSDAPPGELRAAIAGDVVFLIDGRNSLRAYDARSGAFRWQRRLVADVSAGVTAAGDLLLLGTRHGEVLALAQQDGKPRWRAQVSSEVLAPPTVAEGAVVVRAGDGRLYALELADGARRWVLDRPIPSLTLRGVGPAVITDGVVYAGFANGKLLAVSLRDAAVLWEVTVANPQGRSELERMVDVDAAPLVSGDAVYAVAYQGRAVALTRDTGRVSWTRELSAHDDLAHDGDQLYLRDEQGDLWALDRRTGAALWKQDALHRRAVSAPVVFGDALVVADVEGYLHWLARGDGRVIGRFHVGDAGIVGTPRVAADLLYAVGRDGALYALRTYPKSGASSK